MKPTLLKNILEEIRKKRDLINKRQKCRCYFCVKLLAFNLFLFFIFLRHVSRSLVLVTLFHFSLQYPDFALFFLCFWNWKTRWESSIQILRWRRFFQTFCVTFMLLSFSQLTLTNVFQHFFRETIHL